jgi:parallel beta-helix repeat protein
MTGQSICLTRKAIRLHSKGIMCKHKAISILVTMFLISGIIVSALMFLSLTSENASAGTLYVGGGGPGNYTTIQAAINSAFSGDTIYVYPNIYIEGIIIPKSIDLVGIEILNSQPVIDAGGIFPDVVRIANVNYLNLTGFEIRNSTGAFDTAGIRIDSSTYVNISDNKIHDNNIGIYIISSSYNNVYSNEIFDNTANGIKSKQSSNGSLIGNVVSGSWAGIRFDGCPYYGNRIIGNIVHDNLDGIYMDDATPGPPWFWDNLVMNNTVYNYEDRGIYLGMSSDNYVIDNRVYDIISVPINPWGGISCNACVNTTITDNMIYNGIYGLDLRLDFSGGPLLLNFNNTIENNTVYANDIGIRVSEGTNNTFIENSVFNNNYSVYLTKQSIGTNFINNSLSNASVDDFYITENSHATTLNTTFDKDKVHYGDKSSSLTVNWFMHVRVIYSTGGPVAGAFVEVFDNLGSPIAARFADPDGQTKWIIATEYFEYDMNGDSIGDRLYFTQHNATGTDGTLVGYAIPEPFMDESKEVLIVLVIVLPDYVPWDTPPPQQSVIVNTIVPLASRVKNVGILGAATGSTIAFYNQSTPLSPFKFLL